MHSLDGRVAIVTGGARGIGASIAQVLAEHGADIAILDWNLDGVQSVIEMAQVQWVRAMALRTNVSSSAEVNQAVEAVFAACGRIDMLVNNAEICPFRDLLSITDEIWEKTLNVNLTGMFYLVRAVAPIMMKQQRGTIVNISTVSTHLCSPHQVHYIASKGGVDALTRALAVSLAPYGIRVNAVAPAGASTAINANMEEQNQAWEQSGVGPIHRFIPLGEGTPQDYANGVLYLVSDESSFVTGIVLSVDGGALIV